MNESPTNSEKDAKIKQLRIAIDRAIERGDESLAEKYEKDLIALEKGVPIENEDTIDTSTAEANKLFIFRDINGNPSLEIIEFYRKLNDALEKKFESYIALLPVGSHTRGYSNKYSDIDIRFLVDKSKSDTNECIVYLEHEFPAEFKDENTTEFHSLITITSEENIKKGLLPAQSDPSSLVAAETLALLSMLALGNRLTSYRKCAKNQLVNLSLQEKDILIRSATSFIVQLEQQSLSKIENRHKGQFDARTFIKKRRILWETRLTKLWM